MPERGVSVAIPVLNGGALLREVLDAVGSQQLERPVQLVVADSGSDDGSRELAAGAGAELIDIAPGEFAHGRARNRLMEHATGTHVAFLTQDSVPADSRWLRRLLDSFDLDDNVALSFGPYRARPDASPMVRRELEELFRSFSPDGAPQVDRAGARAEGKAFGRAAFFSSANGCVARAAWEEVPFRDVAYAEDQWLAGDMLRAGFAKAYDPAAAVIHSHEHSPVELLRRSFDEWRALADVHDHVATASPLRVGLTAQHEVRADLALMRRDGVAGGRLVRGALVSARHHLMRLTGAALGSRSTKLPAALRGRLSLEGRG